MYPDIIQHGLYIEQPRPIECDNDGRVPESPGQCFHFPNFQSVLYR